MNMTRERDGFSRDLVRDALDALRADDISTPVPARIERNVMREWDARRKHRPRRSIARAWFGAVAASIAAAVVLSRTGVVTRDSSRPEHGPHPAASVAAEMLFTAGALADDPASLQYVQVRMPQSALADFGLPIADPADDQAVVVEVLIGLDGAPRALRLLSKEMP